MSRSNPASKNLEKVKGSKYKRIKGPRNISKTTHGGVTLSLLYCISIVFYIKKNPKKKDVVHLLFV